MYVQGKGTLLRINLNIGLLFRNPCSRLNYTTKNK